MTIAKHSKKSRAKPAAVTKTKAALRKEAREKLPKGDRRKMNGGNSTGTKPRKSSGNKNPGTTVVVDATNWRKKIQASKIKFDDIQKAIFIKVFSETGRLFEAANAADVSTGTVRNHLTADPEFEEAYERAKAYYREQVVHKVVQKVALEGVLEPIVGGKFKDEVVAHKRVFATNILAMEMKRVDPGYREKAEVDVNMRGGVLIMPATIPEEEWIAKYSKAAPDSVTGGNTYDHEKIPE
jgi:hypothetical protein